LKNQLRLFLPAPATENRAAMALSGKQRSEEADEKKDEWDHIYNHIYN
jgi:hypothetical protein